MAVRAGADGSAVRARSGLGADRVAVGVREPFGEGDSVRQFHQYGEDLGHPEYAQPYYQQIMALDPNNAWAWTRRKPSGGTQKSARSQIASGVAAQARLPTTSAI